MTNATRYVLCFYVPEKYAEVVKSAVFEAGAGRLGDYENCCWQTLGQGQFKPIEGAVPFIGSVDRLERVAEMKVEMICQEDHLKDAVAALKEAHPYEEPAFHVLKMDGGF